MKAAIETLGCRVNLYDSEAMTELFLKDGYEIVDFTRKSDVYVINTCTVTHMGDRRSRQYIRRARRLNPDAVICVVGCYSQVAPEEIAAMEEVDIVLGSRNKSRVVEFANRSLATGEKLVEVSDILSSHKFEPLNISNFKDKTRAFLKIQDGCNRFCTYCMIPFARGGISSKEFPQVVQEMHTLAEHGFREVILSGIHIASYGLDLPSGKDKLLLKPASASSALLDLLEEAETIPGLERIRIGSIEPMFFRGETLKRITSYKKLCPHFHLSLQSGSDSVLRRMNRRYTVAEYAEVVDALRKALPGISITTDIITGFPGETEEEHAQTVAFLEKMQLTKTHIFKYSPREGTPAARMEGQVAPEVKDRRAAELAGLSDQNEDTFHQTMVGETHRVLFESRDGVHMKGFAENYVEVKVETEEDLCGQLVPVTITGTGQHCCFGKLL